jgi:hypothetical protein
MASQPDLPALTPQFCFKEVALRDFLRLSRSTLDDSISQSLNALRTPTPLTFSPSPSLRRPSKPQSQTLPTTACSNFKDTILFPTWHARSQVLTYCSTVATSPDPLDPTASSRQAEQEAANKRLVDERLDPYSARWFPSESRTERLARVVREERGVEEIVRRRTWEVVGLRCGGRDRDMDVDEAVREWEERQRRKGGGV